MRTSGALLLVVLAMLLLPAGGARAELDDLRKSVSIGDFFREGEINRATLSPQGSYVAYYRDHAVIAGSEYYGYHTVLRMGRNARLTDLAWSGDGILLVQYYDSYSGQRWLYAVEIGESEGGKSFGALRSSNHEIDGYIFDPLPDSREHILFARVRAEGDAAATDLYRLNLFELTHPQTRLRYRLNRNANNLFYYLTDADNQLVLGISFLNEQPELWHTLNPRRGWEHIWTAPRDAHFRPVQLSADAQTLYALSNAETDKIAAVAFDLTSGSIRETLFEHDRYDLDRLLFSDSHDAPIGVAYFEEGLLRHHYFSEDERAVDDELSEILHGQSVVIIDRSSGNEWQLVYASSTQNAGSIHICNVGLRSCDLVERVRPWLTGFPLAESVAMRVASADGLEIDAFLTIPAEAPESLPLIAMPHGGPIGVSDNLHYSPDVQWLALHGYAVLQVNYRGSGGYGRAFESAGLREWGRGIEEDVEAAVTLALEEYPMLDGDRVCAVGASYGGYSALMSVIRNPDLFKCAASFAGVTDLTLLFNRSDIRRSEEMKDELVRMVGSPDVDYDELVSLSPVYRYQEISRPIFLAHGDNDPVVDIEHSWRLKTLLNMIGIEPEFVVLERVEHGFRLVEQAQAFYDPLIEFLDRHLKPVANADEVMPAAP